MNPIRKLDKIQKKNKSLLCVGLDADFEKLPARFKKRKFPQFEFNKWIIEQTHEYVCAYKPNTAFYEARGSRGWQELEMTAEYLGENFREIFAIVDAKRADIGNTNLGYVTAFFDKMNFDAITLQPYLGKEAIQPFLDRKDKVSIILCRTSNDGAGEFQDLAVLKNSKFQLTNSKQITNSNFQNSKQKVCVWEFFAKRIADDWNKNRNCMLVVGATYPRELAKIRKIAGDMTFLVPGIGAQGGDLKAVLKAGLNSQGRGLIINSSRGIIFADNPGQAAKKLHLQINEYR